MTKGRKVKRQNGQKVERSKGRKKVEIDQKVEKRQKKVENHDNFYIVYHL